MVLDSGGIVSPCPQISCATLFGCKIILYWVSLYGNNRLTVVVVATVQAARPACSHHLSEGI